MYKLEDIQVQDFGQVGEVIITKDDTLFMKVSTCSLDSAPHKSAPALVAQLLTMRGHVVIWLQLAVFVQDQHFQGSLLISNYACS